MNSIGLRALPFVFPLVLLLLLALAPSPEAAEPTTPGTQTRKIGRTASSSVFSLFNLKPRSKFWTESVMRTEFDDLKSSASRDSSNKALLNFTRAGTIANYMNLPEVDSIYLPIPVNFIFIGFDGKGGHEFKLSPEELERWFTKIDHIFEHTRIPPVGEVLTPFYKTSVKKLKQYDLPLVSHVNHNFSVHAIHMGEDVMSVFEHAIKVLSRREDPMDPRENGVPMWQVDSDQMEHVFSTLVDHLQIQEAWFRWRRYIVVITTLYCCGDPRLQVVQARDRNQRERGKGREGRELQRRGSHGGDLGTAAVPRRRRTPSDQRRLDLRADGPPPLPQALLLIPPNPPPPSSAEALPTCSC